MLYGPGEIVLSPTEKLVVRYDDDYQIESDERELTDEQVQEEIDLIEREGVYGVELHKLNAWTRVTDAGTPLTKEEWECEDSIWGCFLDDKYTATTVAVEHFELSAEALQNIAKIK